MWRVRWVVAACLVAALAVPVTGHAASPAYLTILLGRTTWMATHTPGCLAYAGSVPLDEVAEGLRDRGIAGVGGVVIERTDETQRFCQGYTNYASWADLATLRERYGWTFVSQSRTYVDMTTLATDEQRRAESCATLDDLAAHGHSRAWGLFNYPDDQQDAAAQQVVTSCFAYGRKYAETVNTQTSTSSPAHPVHVRRSQGGKCNNKALPCYTMKVPNNRRYTPPAALRTKLSPGAGTYAVVQFYRFVRGAQRNQWDCSSADWTRHWTFQSEVYCLRDFYAALDARTGGAIVTDPATVAEAWGRGAV